MPAASTKPLTEQTPAELRGTALHLGKAFPAPRTAAQRRQLVAWIEARQYSYATMTVSGSYGATVQAPDLCAAMKAAEAMGYKVLDVTTALRENNRRGNPQGMLLVIAE